MGCPVLELDDHRPHLVISDSNGNEHVVPISCFERVISGDEILISEHQAEDMINRGVAESVK